MTFAKGSKPLFGYVRDAKVSNLNIFGTYIDGYGLVENYVVDYGKDGKNWTDDDPKAVITAEKVRLRVGREFISQAFLEAMHPELTMQILQIVRLNRE